MSRDCDICGRPLLPGIGNSAEWVAQCSGCGRWGLSDQCIKAFEAGELEIAPRAGGVHGLLMGLNLPKELDGQFDFDGQMRLPESVCDFRSDAGSEFVMECECISLWMLRSIVWGSVRPNEKCFCEIMGEAFHSALSANLSVGLAFDLRERCIAREAEYGACPPIHKRTARPSEGLGFAFGKHISEIAGLRPPHDFFMALSCSDSALIHCISLGHLGPFFREIGIRMSE